jgi:hypothetical protein
MARRWDRVNQWLFSNTAACVAACVGAIIVVGCMNISLGGHSAAVSVPLAEEQGTFEQTGRLPVRTGPDPVCVFYAVPFASPPNLDVEDPSGQCDIIEQKENCFKVRFHANVTSSPQTLAWKARGTRASQTPATPAAATIEMSQPLPSTPSAPAQPMPSMPSTSVPVSISAPQH